MPFPYVVLTKDELTEARDYLLTQDAFAFDVETWGPYRGSPKRNDVLWIAFASHDFTIVVPMGHPNGDVLISKATKKMDKLTRKYREIPAVWDAPPAQLKAIDVFDILEPLFFSEDITKIAHNATFDLLSVNKYYGGQTPFPPYRDTIVEAWLLDENRRLGLKPLTESTFGHKYDDEGVGKRVEIHPFSKVARYQFFDVRYTWLHDRRQMSEIKRLKLERTFRMEMDVLDVLCSMINHGAPVDMWALRRLDSDLSKSVVELEAEVYRHSPVGKFNLNSPHQKANILWGAEEKGGLGLTPTKLTDGAKARSKTDRTAGNLPTDWSTDEKSIEIYRDVHPMVGSLLDYQETHKLLNTYARAYLGTEDEPGKVFNGRIHPDFVQYGTVTGRFSSRAPNLQNIPRPDTDLGRRVRGLFVPATPDDVLVVADYCVHPDTRVFTSDFRWVRAGDISVGDSVVGFDEFGDTSSRDSKFRTTSVTGTDRVVHECYRVTTNDGRSFIAAADHLWSEVGSYYGEDVRGNINYGSKRVTNNENRKWVKTKNLVPGKSKLSWWVKPWESDDIGQYDSGWLSGVLDGEGWIHYNRGVGSAAGFVAFGQKPGLVLSRFNNLCDKYGLTRLSSLTHKSGVVREALSYESSMRVLGVTRPSRLLENAGVSFWEGRRTFSKNTPPATVTSVEYVGRQETVALKTDSYTFIAEGFLTHNCQVELVILAHYAGKGKLWDGFFEGHDPHTATAAAIFQVTYDKVEKWQRTVAKNINFAILYGARPEKVAAMSKISVSDAKKFLKLHAGMFPEVYKFKDWCVNRCYELGYIRTLSGRYRRLPDIYSSNWADRSRAERQALNSLIQGTNADITKMAMIRAHRTLHDDMQLILTIHDELVTIVPREKAEIGVEIITEAMVGPAINKLLKTPLRIDIKVVERWSDAK